MSTRAPQPTNPSWESKLTFQTNPDTAQRIVGVDGTVFFAVSPRLHQALARLHEERVPANPESTIAALRLSLPDGDAEALTNKLFAERTDSRTTSPAVLLWHRLKNGLIRFPLWQPTEAVVDHLEGRVLTPWSVGVWAACVLAALGSLLLGALPAVADPLRLTPAEIFALWLAFTLTTVWHELGHVAAAAHHGIRTKSVGIALFYLMPAGYADLSAAWLKSKRARIEAALGGLWFQSMALLVAYVVWRAAEIPLLGLYCVGSLIGIAFNLIPFVRLDGYWVLSHALEIPNLRQRCIDHLHALFDRRKKPQFFGAASGLSRAFAGLSLMFAAGLYLSAFSTAANWGLPLLSSPSSTAHPLHALAAGNQGGKV
jgi:hypothetical protein